jgi:histidinol-phosphate aminotransferase
VARTVRTIRRERESLARALARLGFEPFPTDANFLAARAPIPPGWLCARLEARGILIKDLSRLPALAGCVRITVGPPRINARLLRALRAVLAAWRRNA